MSRSGTLRLGLGFLLLVTLSTGGYLATSSIYLMAKAELAQYLLEHSWASAKANQRQSKPWPWADTHPIAKLSVDKLDWSAIILAGTSGEALAFGPGHWRDSAQPGTLGNSVIAGHRESHFNILKSLHIGDSVRIERRDGQMIKYVVDTVNVVHETDLTVLANSDETKLTLITCYPVEAVTAGGELRLAITASANARDDLIQPRATSSGNLLLTKI